MTRMSASVAELPVVSGTRRLLAVQGPLQFVAGYTALGWLAADTGADDQLVLLMYDFLMSPAIEPEFARVIEQLAAVRPWTRIVFIDSARMNGIMGGKYSGAVAALHAVLGSADFDEIYLARDFCGHGSPLIGNAYPAAKKIAYGDSLGLVGDRADFADFDASRPIRSVLSACKRAARRFLLGGPSRYHFDAAVLSLPLDLSRGELDAIALIVPPKQHVQRSIRAVAEPLVGLREYSRELLDFAGASSAHLLLLSNLSGSGLMSAENEIALYVHIVTTNTGRGDTVFLKVHPRSSREVIDAVVARLSGAVRIKVIDDPGLARLPVELWSDLLDACSVIAVFSTAALNIKYVYDKDVALPLSDELVERYIFPHKIEYIKTANRMIEESIAALSNWDCRSVLWKKYP